MDEKTFKERAKRLQEVNNVISKLDPAIRGPAFSLLQSFITETSPKTTDDDLETDDETTDFPGMSDLVSKHPHDKPSDNVRLAAAYFYSQYGTKPLSVGAIKKIADHAGITVPTNITMTLKQAKKDGKTLFRKVGARDYSPTVHGESFFRTTYGVKKGLKAPPGKDQS